MLRKLKTLDCVFQQTTIFLALCLAGCVNTISQPELVTSGVGKSSLSLIKEELETGGDPLVVIWNHGQPRGNDAGNCYSGYNAIPTSLQSLASSFETHFLFVCNKLTDNRNQPGSYIYKRVEQTEQLLQQIHDFGVNPNRVFLSGHSAGGWTALHLFRTSSHLFNGAIAFAPAFAGPRHETNKAPQWRRVARPSHVKKIIRAEEMNALVFAYEDDDFNRPLELQFLQDRYPKGVRLVGYECGYNHGTHLNDCRMSKTKEIIKNFVAKSIGSSS